MRLDNYLFTYLDRRMNLIIADWQLSTHDDLTDLTKRFSRVQDDLVRLKGFEKETSERISNLEKRIANIREKYT